MPEEMNPLVPIIEAALLASSEPLTVTRIIQLFREAEAPTADEVALALDALHAHLEGHGFELKQVASGYRLQVRSQYAAVIQNLWEEKPARYSKALMETLSLIAYRQPITRGEIEAIRGVAVSSQMVRTLQDHEWIRVVGYKEIPGRPALFATTKNFLDYFQLKSLDELPPLSAIDAIGTLPSPEVSEASKLNEDPDGDVPETPETDERGEQNAPEWEAESNDEPDDTDRIAETAEVE